jgi:hypothetical protein
MAEPFSIFTAAASLVDIVARTSKGLWRIYNDLHNAPALILVLSNEAADLGVILDLISDSKQSIQQQNAQQDAKVVAALDQQLQKARGLLNELDALANTLTSMILSKKRLKWVLKKRNALALKDQLKGVRRTLNEILFNYNV